MASSNSFCWVQYAAMSWFKNFKINKIQFASTNTCPRYSCCKKSRLEGVGLANVKDKKNEGGHIREIFECFKRSNRIEEIAFEMISLCLKDSKFS